MRLSGPEAAQQYLQDTMLASPGDATSSSSSSVATVTNYFEHGEGRWLPHGVQGKQPAANSELRETAVFTYVALIPDIPRDMCGKPLQVIDGGGVVCEDEGGGGCLAAGCAVVGGWVGGGHRGQQGGRAEGNRQQIPSCGRQQCSRMLR
jgi:hypothetical protein